MGRLMSLIDSDPEYNENRMDHISRNGNDGLHYDTVIVPLDLFKIVLNRCVDDKIRLRLKECLSA